MIRSGLPEIDLPGFRDRLEAAATDVLTADLQAWRLVRPYLVLATEAGFRADLGVWGLYSTSYCGGLRDAIGQRWAGPGPVVILFDNAIQSSGFSGQELLSRLAAVAVHEVAHAVTEPSSVAAGIEWNCPEVAAAVAIAGQVTRNSLRKPLPQETTASQETHHGPRFLRVMVHLADRFQRVAGMRLHWPALIRGRVDALQVARLLRAELIDLRDETLSGIASLPIPGPLMAEWLQAGQQRED